MLGMIKQEHIILHQKKLKKYFKMQGSKKQKINIVIVLLKIENWKKECEILEEIYPKVDQ